MNLDHLNKAITVSELNRRVKQLLETNFLNLWIQGEISDVTKYPSGHWYFSLKDNKNKVSCVLFKQQVPQIKFEFKKGADVQLTGQVTLYTVSGQYQIIVEKIELQGQGKLYLEYERLKEKLEKLGYFAKIRKKKIPFFPHRIGVITSQSGAALRDILITLRRRMSQIEVIIYPVMVQGQGSELQITNAIELANHRNEVDVLIVARGGGSLEDLWAFNEEIVNKAIYNSNIPIVSGVGHEIDVTLTDFSADIRAPTPTAAAELTSPDRDSLLKELITNIDRLNSLLLGKYNTANQRLDLLHNALISPDQMLRCQQQELLSYQKMLKHHVSVPLMQKKLQFKYLLKQLIIYQPNLNLLKQNLFLMHTRHRDAMVSFYARKTSEVERLNQLIQANSPARIQAKGYSIITDVHKKVLTSCKQLHHQQKLNIHFIDGEATAIVDH